MLFKFAICKNAEITEIKNDAMLALSKVASARHWSDPSAFPKKYQNLISNYVKAHAISNKVQVGAYDPDFKYYRVIALHGDVPNDNGDLWWWGSESDNTKPELLRYDDLIEKHVFETFAGRGNFKNHENDDVSKAVGIVLDAAPNFDGKFVEALIAVDQKKDPELVRGIDSGYINSVSMGCICGYSICTACGNRATQEHEYCDHLKYQKGQNIYYNGEWVKVAEDSRAVNFIELSWVTVPADPHAKMLEKVASEWKETLSNNSKVIYEVVARALDDAKLISGPEEYNALIKAVSQKLQ